MATDKTPTPDVSASEKERQRLLEESIQMAAKAKVTRLSEDDPAVKRLRALLAAEGIGIEEDDPKPQPAAKPKAKKTPRPRGGSAS